MDNTLLDDLEALSEPMCAPVEHVHNAVKARSSVKNAQLFFNSAHRRQSVIPRWKKQLRAHNMHARKRGL